MTTGYAILGTSPTPLTYGDEIKYLKSWKKNKNRKSHEALIKNYLLFTVKKVRAMYQHLPQDAVMQIAHRSLLQSIEGFDPKRAKVGRLSNLIPWFARMANKEYIRESETVKLPVAKNEELCPFVSLDAACVNEVSDGHLRGAGCDNIASRYEVGLTYLHYSPDTAFDTLFDFSGSALDEKMRQEKRSAIIDCLNVLPTKERRILDKVYFKGWSYARIGRENNPEITREAVRQQHTKALQHLRQIVRARGIASHE